MRWVLQGLSITHLDFHGILMGSIPPETMVDGEPGISLGPIVVRHGEANLGGLDHQKR